MTFGLGLLPLQDLREIKDAIAEEKRGREETQVQIDDSAELIGPFFSISIMRVVCKPQGPRNECRILYCLDALKQIHDLICNCVS